MGKIVDLTGQKFGRLTVIKLHGLDKRNKTLWECKGWLNYHENLT